VGAGSGPDPASTTSRLRSAGCVAAEDEAAELIDAAAGDRALLDALVSRRCRGEPLAWLVGSVRFCGERVTIHPGVYVVRWQSEPLALEAVRRLPHQGRAVDLCCGSGAIALVMARRRPGARVVASDIDPVAVECARANGIEAYAGDVASGLPTGLGLTGQVDVVTAVPPYVPTAELRLLPRDTLAYEPRAALDGGPDGTELLQRVVAAAAGLLRPGGSLLVELGGDEAARLRPTLEARGYRDIELLADDDGDLRGLCCRR